MKKFKVEYLASRVCELVIEAETADQAREKAEAHLHEVNRLRADWIAFDDIHILKLEEPIDEEPPSSAPGFAHAVG